MAGKNTAAYGLYSDRVQVEEAIDAFVKARFRPEQISVLFPDNEGTTASAHEKNTKAPEGTAAGVGAGGAIGGTLGLLVGIGALAIPGSDHSSPPGRSWRHWPVWVREGLSVV